MRTRTTILLTTTVVVLLSSAAALAGKWKPYDFKGAAFYKYRITKHEKGGKEQVVFTFEAKPAASTGSDRLWDVTTSTQRVMKEDELKGAAVFGVSPILTLAPTLMIGHPLFATMIGEMELEVGEKLSFFGAGKAHVVDKVTVAGVEGFRCELFMKDGEAEKRVAEVVVNPDLAFPLRSRTFDGEAISLEMELLEYRK